MLYFDIGANVGGWTLANLSSDVGATIDKVVAVEASPKTFQKLINRCGNLPKVECLNFVVCDVDSKDVVPFYYCEAFDAISTMNRDWFESKNSRFYRKYPYEEIQCPVIKLDRLIDQYGIPDLIKIDVESAEFRCLASLTNKDVPMICFEWASEAYPMTFQCLNYLYRELEFRKFAIQMEDEFTYRPTQYEDIGTIKKKLLNMRSEIDWGMIWCIKEPS